MCMGTQEWPVQPKTMPEGGTNLLSNKKISNPSGWLPENAFFERVEHVHISLVFVNKLTAVFQMDWSWAKILSGSPENRIWQ